MMKSYMEYTKYTEYTQKKKKENNISINDRTMTMLRLR